MLLKHFIANSVGIVFGFGLKDTDNVDQSKLWNVFSLVTALITPALFAWTYILHSHVGTLKLKNRDENLKTVLIPSSSTDSLMNTMNTSAVHEIEERNNNPSSDTEKETNMELYVATAIQKHRSALFLIIFCSILQGSFLSYVQAESSGSQLGTVLYFVRIFSDFIGRPLTLWVVPPSLQDVDGLLIFASARAIFMIYFFLYICIPKDKFYRSDICIIAFQVIYFTTYICLA